MKTPIYYTDPLTGFQYFEGHGILVHNNKIDSLGTFLGFLIRLVLGTYWNHVASVVEHEGQLWIYEAIEKGTGRTKLLKSWLYESHAGYRNYKVILPGGTVSPFFRDRYLETDGKKYDYLATFYFQPLRLILDKFKFTSKLRRGSFQGHTGDHAKWNWYCSELYAYGCDLLKWWTITPKDLDKFPALNTYKHGLPS